MEHQLWSEVQALIRELARPGPGRCDYSDSTIARTYYWAVLHDRPTAWACDPKNWPPHARRQALPPPWTMSRRLRSPSVVALLEALDRALLRPASNPPLVHLLDGKPLPIGGCSTDRQAGYGRAAGCKAKGYKLHALVGSDGSLPVWRVAPMNKDERVMARRLLRQAEIQGYVLADGNYDDNHLHAICDAKGEVQLLTRRRYGNAKGLGHRRQTPGRLRSIERVYHPTSDFGRTLLAERGAVERYFGNLTSYGGGLTHLPPWGRGHRRVRRWVQAKLVLNCLRMQLRQRTYVA
jgi:DDE family transposase